MNTQKSVVQPYLFFNGRCEEAIEFYRKALGAEVEMIIRHKESPEPPPPGMIPPGFENKIMHASFRIGATTLMASDGCSNKETKFEGFSLSISVASEAEADQKFAALAEGGQVQMPLSKTFWSPRFGMLTDKFGIGWMISMEPPGKPFVISRTFDAPREKVWNAWTNRDQLMQWFGPKGMTMSHAKMDFRRGGSFHYALRGADGKEMWGKFVYHEIKAPECTVLVSSFSDENGGITRHPFAPTWPRETLSKTTFAEENGKTKITIEWSPLNATDEEQKTFDSSHDGMRQGWSGTFDQLAEFLAKS